jgi:hypothetical protein
MIRFFEINYFRLTISSYVMELTHFLVSRRAAYAKLGSQAAQ